MLRGRTMKAPPPADSTMMARNLGLTAQKVESHDDLDTLMLSKHWSLFSPVPYTCRNLLERTTRKDILLDGLSVRHLRTMPGKIYHHAKNEEVQQAGLFRNFNQDVLQKSSKILTCKTNILSVVVFKKTKQKFTS